MVVTVFLLFCTVLSFTWGPKCILCVSIVIYQEFCEILWRVFVLVLLYLVSCTFSTVSSLSMSSSLTLYLFYLCPSICFNSNWFPVIPDSGAAIDISQQQKKNPTSDHRGKKIKVLKVTDLISVWKSFQGNGRMNARADEIKSCEFLSKYI